MPAVLRLGLGRCENSGDFPAANTRPCGHEFAMSATCPNADALRLGHAVADTRFSQDDMRIVRLWLDLSTKLTDVDPKILGIFRMRGPPDGGENLLVGHNLSGMAGEECKEFELLRCQPDLDSGPGDAMAC